MRQIEAEVRKAVEHTAEDQAGHGNARIKRVTDEVFQIKLLEPVLPAAYGLRVDKHRQIQLGDLRPEYVQARIAQVHARNV